MKFIKILLVSYLLVFSVSVYAQNDEDWVSETYETGHFTRINLEGGFKVFLVQGEVCELTVRATDNDIFDEMEVKNYQGTLEVEVDRKPFDFDRVNLYITFKTLQDLKIKGGIKLKTRGYLDLNDLRVKVEGGAKIELELKAEDVDIISEGGVLFEIQGVAESLNVAVSGAGHVDAEELKAKNVNFRIEGVGTGNVYATETLDAKIEGVGKVKYRGNPKVNRSIDAIGSVSRD